MSRLSHLAHGAVQGELTPASRRAGADSGDPQLKTLPLDAAPGVLTGVWECQPGGWPVVDRTDTEVCYILSGRAVLTDTKTGETTEIAGGSFLVLPKGWSGRWDVIEPVRKIYAIF